MNIKWGMDPDNPIELLGFCPICLKVEGGYLDPMWKWIYSEWGRVKDVFASIFYTASHKWMTMGIQGYLLSGSRFTLTLAYTCSSLLCQKKKNLSIENYKDKIIFWWNKIKVVLKFWKGKNTCFVWTPWKVVWTPWKFGKQFTSSLLNSPPKHLKEERKL